MADLFTRLAKRTLGLMPVVQPRIVSRFAQEEAMASENANIEIPSLFEGDRGLRPGESAAGQQLLPKEENIAVNDKIEADRELAKTILVDVKQEEPPELDPKESSIAEREREKGENAIASQIPTVQSKLRRANQEEVRIPTREVIVEKKSEETAGKKESRENAIASQILAVQSELRTGNQEEVRIPTREVIVEKKSEMIAREKSGSEETVGKKDRIVENRAQDPRREEMGRDPKEERDWTREKLVKGEERESAIGEKGRSVELEKSQSESGSESNFQSEKQIASVTEYLTGSSRSDSREERAISPRKSGSDRTEERSALSRMVTETIFSREPGESKKSGKEITPDSSKEKSPEVDGGDGIEGSESRMLEERYSPRDARFVRESEKSEMGSRDPDRDDNIFLREEGLRRSEPEKALAPGEKVREGRERGKVGNKTESAIREKENIKLVPSENTKEEKVWSKPVDRSLTLPVAGSPQTPLKKGGFRNPPLLEEGVEGDPGTTTFDRTQEEKIINYETVRTIREDRQTRQRPVQSQGKISGEESTIVSIVTARSPDGDESEKKIAEIPRQWQEKDREEGMVVTEREPREKSIDKEESSQLESLRYRRRGEEQKASAASAIEITIGKIEVKGSKPAAKPVQKSSRIQSTGVKPRLSLEEYLRQRNGEKI